MPLAALTPVLNDLLNKDAGNTSSFPQQQNQISVTTDSSLAPANSLEYLRHSSNVSNQLTSSNSAVDVSRN